MDPHGPALTLGSKKSVTRRRALGFIGATLTTGITPGNPPQQSETLATFLNYGLIDALEEHGQWAAGLNWARGIHQSIGANVTLVARASASGQGNAKIATRLALQRLVVSEYPPDGAVVVVYGRPGVLQLRDAHSAYRMIRSSLRPGAYCAYSPLFDEGPGDQITAEVTLGWRTHRTE